MNKLTTRCHRLKDYLYDNFESGKYFSIEEICGAGLGYKLNLNARCHDRCLPLAQDVKKLNWATNVERYIPIIKNKQGGIKLCESEQELKDFVAKEEKRVEKICEYKNHLKSLINVDGSVPIINLANRALKLDEMKPVDVYKKDTTELADQSR